MSWLTLGVAVPIALGFLVLAGLFLLSSGKQARDDRALAWQFVDAQGAPQFGRQFEDALPFADGVAPVRTPQGWGAIDRAGSFVIPPRFDALDACAEGLCAAREGALWGYIDRAGAWVIPPTLHRAHAFHAGIAPAALSLGLRGGRSAGSAPVIEASYGLLRADGTWLRPPASTREAPDRLVGIRPQGEDRWAVSYADRSSGFLAADGQPTLGRFQQTRPFAEGRAAVQQDGKWGVIDRDGAAILPPRFGLRGEGLVDGRIALIAAEGGFFADRDGGVVARDFEDVGPFADGLAAVKRSGRWGFVDRAGIERIAPAFARVEHPFAGGAAIARSPDDPSQVVFVFADGRVQGGYAEARPYADGVAPVRVPRWPAAE